MSRLRRRNSTPAEHRLERLRLARVTAPILRDLRASATRVSVQLTFANDICLAQSPRWFAVYPPARAHFVYACAFSDCDGMHDLDEEVFGMLRASTCQAAGLRHCFGHRSCRSGQGRRCGLGMTYEVSVTYEAPRPEAAGRLALAL